MTDDNASEQHGTGCQHSAVTSLPDHIWVRHRDTVQKVPLCSDTIPYSSVLLMRWTAGWHPGDLVEPQLVVRSDGSRITVAGSGISRDDPMFCAELQSEALPTCLHVNVNTVPNDGI